MQSFDNPFVSISVAINSGWKIEESESVDDQNANNVNFLNTSTGM